MNIHKRKRSFIAAVLLLGILSGLMSANGCGSDAPTEMRKWRKLASNPVAAPTSPETNPAIARMEKARADKEVVIRALEKAAAGDERGDLLIAFHKENAYYSVLIGGGGTMGILDSASEVNPKPLEFEVTLASSEERERNGLRAFSDCQWYSERNQLFVPPHEAMTEEWLGVVFAHELSHAYDAVTGLEPRNLPVRDKRFLAGELRAYMMEFRLLNRMTKGKYGEAILGILKERNFLTGPPEKCIKDSHLPAEDLRKVDALFPPSKNSREKMLRNGMTLLALIMLRSREMKGGGGAVMHCLHGQFTAIGMH